MMPVVYAAHENLKHENISIALKLRSVAKKKEEPLEFTNLLNAKKLIEGKK